MRRTVRSRILEVAGKLFMSRGYHGVGVNELIRESGVAKATFYNHFETKESLCLAWLEVMHRSSVEKHDRILADPKDAVSKLMEYFEELRGWFEATGFSGCPYSNTSVSFSGGSEAVDRSIREHKLYVRNFFVELIGQIRNGSDPGLSAEEIRGIRNEGEVLFYLYCGVVSESRHLRSLDAVDSAIKHLKGIFQ